MLKNVSLLSWKILKFHHDSFQMLKELLSYFSKTLSSVLFGIFGLLRWLDADFGAETNFLFRVLSVPPQWAETPVLQ